MMELLQIAKSNKNPNLLNQENVQNTSSIFEESPRKHTNSNKMSLDIVLEKSWWQPKNLECYLNSLWKRKIKLFFWLKKKRR